MATYGADRTRPGQLGAWLFVLAGLVGLILVVGGATRLTESGLSITRWDPVTGVVPPLDDAAWQAEFDAYRVTPEYQLVNHGMSLDEFKTIFLWEYLHRLLGRVLGLAMALPFLWFLARGSIPRGYGWRLGGLVLLIALQGAIGWWMVTSGLVDRPDVAHQRLALHLVTALILLCALVWTALDFRALAASRAPVAGRPKRWLWPFLVLLTVQITLGAFVAGLDAGRIHTTWPTMQGQWAPASLTSMRPVWTNAIDNPTAVQFLHRWLAMVLAAFAIVVAIGLYRAGAGLRAVALEVAVAVQVLLGILTLLHSVPIPLGVAHQFGAVLLLLATIAAGHWASGGARAEPPAPSTSSAAGSGRPRPPARPSTASGRSSRSVAPSPVRSGTAFRSVGASSRGAPVAPW